MRTSWCLLARATALLLALSFVKQAENQITKTDADFLDSNWVEQDAKEAKLGDEGWKSRQYQTDFLGDSKADSKRNRATNEATVTQMGVPSSKRGECYSEYTGGLHQRRGWVFCKRPGYLMAGYYLSCFHSWACVTYYLCCSPTKPLALASDLANFNRGESKSMLVITRKSSKQAADIRLLTSQANIHVRRTALLIRGLNVVFAQATALDKWNDIDAKRLEILANRISYIDRVNAIQEQQRSALASTLVKLDRRMQDSLRYERGYNIRALSIIMRIMTDFRDKSYAQLDAAKERLDDEVNTWKKINAEQDKRHAKANAVKDLIVDLTKRTKTFRDNYHTGTRRFTETKADIERLIAQEGDLKREIKRVRDNTISDQASLSGVVYQMQGFQGTGKKYTDILDKQQEERDIEFTSAQKQLKKLEEEISYLHHDVEARMKVVGSLEPTSAMDHAVMFPQSELQDFFTSADLDFEEIKTNMQQEISKISEKNAGRVDMPMDEWMSDVLRDVSTSMMSVIKKKGNVENLNLTPPSESEVKDEEKVVEGEGGDNVEGEGEDNVEGEGEDYVEGEGEDNVEGEGEDNVEGEGEDNVEGDVGVEGQVKK